MDIRSLQRPLKDQYRQDPKSSRITLTASGRQADAPIACSVDLGRAIYNAQAHQGVGGAGTGACSGDLLLGALAACAQRNQAPVLSGLNEDDDTFCRANNVAAGSPEYVACRRDRDAQRNNAIVRADKKQRDLGEYMLNNPVRP